MIAAAAAERMAARGAGAVVLPTGAESGEAARALAASLDAEWAARGVAVVAVDVGGDIAAALAAALRPPLPSAGEGGG